MYLTSALQTVDDIGLASSHRNLGAIYETNVIQALNIKLIKRIELFLTEARVLL